MFIISFQTIFNDLASIGREQYHKRMDKYHSSAEGIKAAAAKKKSNALAKLGAVSPQSNYDSVRNSHGQAPSSSSTTFNVHHPHQLFNQFNPTTTATEAIKRRVSYDPQDYQRSYHNSLTKEANLAAASIKQMEEELVAARLRVRIMELEAQLQSSTKANDHQARTSPSQSQTLSQKNPLSYLASAAAIKQEGAGMLGYQYGGNSSNKKQRLS